MTDNGQIVTGILTLGVIPAIRAAVKARRTKRIDEMLSDKTITFAEWEKAVKIINRGKKYL